jgi:hypothetical protein
MRTWKGRRQDTRVVHRSTRSGRFLTEVRLKSGGVMPMRVAEGDQQTCANWHRDVQLAHVKGQEARLDKDWEWPLIFWWSSLLEATSGRRTALMKFVASGDQGQEVFLGLMLLADGYKYFPKPRKRAMFVWYLAGAPENYLAQHGVPTPLILSAMIDSAIQFSYLRGYEGRICLHADRHGSVKQKAALMQKYANVGLQNLPATWYKPLLTPARRNDGRYFYTDERKAIALTAALALKRTP